MHTRPMSKLLLADVQLPTPRFDLCGCSPEYRCILRLSHAPNMVRCTHLCTRIYGTNVASKSRPSPHAGGRKRSQLMQLEALRPHLGADLGRLQSLYQEQSWRATLPESLPDADLLALARDFRRVEVSLQIDDEDESPPSMASAVFVVSSLLTREERTEMPPALRITQDGLMRAMQIYQWGLEREIVRRIVGIPEAPQTGNLIERLERCAAG
jgi:hypothetical protein